MDVQKKRLSKRYVNDFFYVEKQELKMRQEQLQNKFNRLKVLYKSKCKALKDTQREMRKINGVLPSRMKIKEKRLRRRSQSAPFKSSTPATTTTTPSTTTTKRKRQHHLQRKHQRTKRLRKLKRKRMSCQDFDLLKLDAIVEEKCRRIPRTEICNFPRMIRLIVFYVRI